MGLFHHHTASDPVILTIPGLNNSCPGHWQSLWEAERDDVFRIDLGMWDRPHRNTWVNKIAHAVADTDRPVILVAHSLGCQAAAWWASLDPAAASGKVVGALLVAPADVDVPDIDARLAAFGPSPDVRLPFSSIVAASQDDPYIAMNRARRLARRWGSQFVDAGWVGHINADSRLEDWPYGKFLLAKLLQDHQMTVDQAVLAERLTARGATANGATGSGVGAASA